MRTTERFAGMDVLLALCGVLLFAAVGSLSGRIAAGDGLGWDGQPYARMVTGEIADGTVYTQTRPLLPLITRIPYAMGLDVIDSFHLMNHVYAFILYLCVALLLRRSGADLRTRACVVVNVALCIATSKMFGFYPALIDLGALAVITGAFYFVATRRRWLGPLACVAAAASREFGIAVAFYGIHKCIRERRFRDAIAFCPALATTLAIRWVVASRAPEDAAPFSLADAVSNLGLWTSGPFIAVFVYFSLTVFGGLSAQLALRPRWVTRRFREEPELATYLLIVVVPAAVGAQDIWRYLVFALPVAIVLIGKYFVELDSDDGVRAMVLVTVATLITQRPFAHMDDALYFRDWFPLYRLDDATANLIPIWSMRLASLLLMMIALASSVRGRVRMAR